MYINRKNMIFRYNTSKETCVIIFPKKRKVEKIFLKKKREIRNELDGNSWYLKNLKIKNKKLNIKNHSTYISVLNLPFHQGQQVKFWQNIKINFSYILRVLNHYRAVWPNQKFVPFHGDLTLSNVIFGNTNKNVKIIDWEFFKKKKCLWGLDICYFLISTLSLPVLTRKNKNIYENEKKIFKRLWKTFFYKQKFEFKIIMKVPCSREDRILTSSV